MPKAAGSMLREQSANMMKPVTAAPDLMASADALPLSTSFASAAFAIRLTKDT
jgi:hypothetical protein